MDGDRFDDLTKSLTAHPSRRFALRLLGAIALGAMPPLGWAEAEKKGKKGKKGKNNGPCGTAGARCCGKKCNPGAVCNAKRYCKCAKGWRNCAGTCIPKNDCCLGGTWVAETARYQQCGLCAGGRLAGYPDYCSFCEDCDQATFLCVAANDGRGCGHSTGGCGTCRRGVCDPLEQTFECVGAENRSCCEPGVDCCQGGCWSACPADEFRDPATCACTCGRQLCGQSEWCEDGLCRSQQCPPPDHVCGATCCAAGEDCCTSTDGSQVCRAPHPTCGSCKAQCTGGKCCAISQICCRAADYTEHCISPGGSC